MLTGYEAVTADDIVERAAQAGLELRHMLPPHRQAVVPGMLATPLPVVHTLWRAAVRKLDDPLFPLRLATRPTEQTRGIVTLAVMVSPHLGEAVHRMVKFWPLVTDAFRWTLGGDRDHMVLATEIPRHASLGWRCGIELHLAGLVHTAQLLTRRAFRPHELRLAHEPPNRVARAFEEMLGARLLTGCGRVELVVERAQMDLAFEAQIPQPLANLVLTVAEQALARVARPPSFVERVRYILEEAPGGERPNLARVARRLGVSTRTLHRRLDDHGTSFQALLAEAQQRLAERLLAEPMHTSEQIADALGLSRRGFFRAFRRWTGVTPAAYRQASVALDALPRERLPGT